MELDELQARRDELWAQMADQHSCDEHLSWRTRPVAGGAKHVVQQCGFCGQQRGGPMAKAKAAQLLGTKGAPPFDEGIEDRRRAARRPVSEEFAEVVARIGAIVDPTGIQEAAEQEQAARAAAQNARGAIDQAVLELQALHWARRQPFILGHLKQHVATFKDPAARPVNRFATEVELRAWLDAWIQQDFDVWPEVSGRHLTEGVRVTIDYVLQPKEHLVKQGFKAGPIGLEVKYLKQEEGFSTKASRFVWQAVSYTDCEFELEGGKVRLPRVLLFSNMSFADELGLLSSIDPSPMVSDRAKWAALLELANHANVGNLEIYGTRGRHSGWRIAFATGVYFRRSNQSYTLSNPRLFEKVRIGNF